MGEEKVSKRAYLPILEIKSPSGSKSVHYPLVYDEFPDVFRLRAMKELNETEEKRRKGVQELKDFMRTHSIAKLDESILTTILRNCKYDMKKSISKLKKFAGMRRETATALSKIPMSTIEKVFDCMGFGFLPYRDSEGKAIMFTRPDDIDPEKYPMDQATTCALAGALFLASFPISSVAGIAYFGECKNPSVYIFCSILHYLRRAIHPVLMLPCRIAKVEILNPNKLASCFYAAVRPILSKKLTDRITFHGYSYEDLCKTYSPEMLPEEFGGNMGPVNNKSYRKELLEFVEKLRSEKT